MKRALLSWILVAMISWVPLLHAQEQEQPPREVKSPFQEELNYSPGQVLTLNLLIDGVHWGTFKLESKNLEDLQPGDTTKVDVINTVENTVSKTKVVSFVFLLEDSSGTLLERLSLDKIKLSRRRNRDDRQKFKLQTDSLIDLSKLYIFAEVN